MLLQAQEMEHLLMDPLPAPEHSLPITPRGLHYPKSSTWNQEAKEASLNPRDALTWTCESSELASELSQQLWLSTGHLCLWNSTQHIQEPLAGAEGLWVQDRLYLPLYGPKLSATPAASPQHCSQAWIGCCGCSWKLPPVRHKPINAAACSAALMTAMAFGNECFQQPWDDLRANPLQAGQDKLSAGRLYVPKEWRTERKREPRLMLMC